MTTMMRKKPSYKRGDVVLVRFPDSNLLSTTARPGLIVQDDNLQSEVKEIGLVEVSSTGCQTLYLCDLNL